MKMRKNKIFYFKKMYKFKIKINYLILKKNKLNYNFKKN